MIFLMILARQNDTASGAFCLPFPKLLTRGANRWHTVLISPYYSPRILAFFVFFLCKATCILMIHTKLHFSKFIQYLANYHCSRNKFAWRAVKLSIYHTALTCITRDCLISEKEGGTLFRKQRWKTSQKWEGQRSPNFTSLHFESA